MRSSPTAKPSVLLIDTQPGHRHLRATIFRNCEMNVQVAESLADALRLCSTTRYDMVLLADRDGQEEHKLACDALWKVAPRQRIAAFVGPPNYVRELVGGHRAVPGQRARSATQLKIVHSQAQQPDFGAFIRRLLGSG